MFLGNIKQAFDKNPNLTNLLLDSFFKDQIQKCQVGVGSSVLGMFQCLTLVCFHLFMVSAVATIQYQGAVEAFCFL